VIAYLDASALLRVAFGEAGQVPEWSHLKHGVSSELVRVECLRTIDRMRVRAPLDDEEVARRSEAVFALVDHLDLIPIAAEVLDRAAAPFPTTLGTLDAIHLASALLWQQSEGQRLDGLFTHDVELGRAARAVGMLVFGCA